MPNNVISQPTVRKRIFTGDITAEMLSIENYSIHLRIVRAEQGASLDALKAQPERIGIFRIASTALGEAVIHSAIGQQKPNWVIWETR